MMGMGGGAFAFIYTVSVSESQNQSLRTNNSGEKKTLVTGRNPKQDQGRDRTGLKIWIQIYSTSTAHPSPGGEHGWMDGWMEQICADTFHQMCLFSHLNAAAH